MATITLKGNKINTCGDLPKIGETARDFILVKNDLSEVSLEDYRGIKKVLSVFPSIDTSTCATSVRTFNKNATEMLNVKVLNISFDLPFAHARFCGAEGIDRVETLSCFRSSFAKDYNLQIIDGPLKGLCSRVIIVVDENNKIIYTEQVAEIANAPDYQAVLSALKLRT